METNSNDWKLKKVESERHLSQRKVDKRPSRQKTWIGKRQRRR
jgi:hypothetical protein